jgi:N-methylhydantoinase A
MALDMTSRTDGIAEQNKSRSGRLPVRLGVDIGGTFTDVAAVDREGILHIGKALTTPTREELGVLSAVKQSGVDLSEVDFLVHGTTLVINALVERRGAEVALVTTQGFRDVHELGRGNRPQPYNAFYRRDPILVPRHRRFEIDERTLASGEVERVPSEEDLSTLTEQIRKVGVHAIAIAFLNSYVNQSNELRVLEYLKRSFPDKYITTSSSISRQWREFERFTTAAANAYVGPALDRYLEEIEKVLLEDGFHGEFTLFDSNAGALHLDSARLYPIRLIESGPAGGVLGAREIAHELGLENVVTFDMGGTTAKTSLIQNGKYISTDLYWVGGLDTGFPVQIPSIEIIEVGAGGGSIAWGDEGGRLRVGPRSAGASPGPACYGLGGEEPTVTDADVYCGRISPTHFISHIVLDKELATQAVKRLAERLKMGPLRLAAGVLTLANLAMAGAVRKQTISRGLDPRDFALIAYGGAGPMHACEVAAEVGIGRVLIPPVPGHFSALGMLQANFRFDRREVVGERLERLDLGVLKKTLSRIQNDLIRIVGGDESDGLKFSYGLALRYQGQEHTLMIQSPAGGTQVPSDGRQVFKKLFEEEYLRRFGHKHANANVEVDEIEVFAERILPATPLTVNFEKREGKAGVIDTYFSQSDTPVRTPILIRSALGIGTTFEGPMIIYEDGSNTVVPPRATGRVIEGGHLMIDVSQIAGGGS